MLRSIIGLRIRNTLGFFGFNIKFPSYECIKEFDNIGQLEQLCKGPTNLDKIGHFEHQVFTKEC